MTEKEMQQFIDDNMSRICCSDAYYQQYLQAKTALDAIMANIEDGSPSAATDLVIINIGNKVYPIGLFNAEAVGAIDEALLLIMRNAVENIYLADPDMTV